MFDVLVLKVWYYSRNNEIRRDDACVDYPGGLGGANKPEKIITFPCHGERGNQEWIYTQVRLVITNLLVILSIILPIFQTTTHIYLILALKSSQKMTQAFFIIIINRYI